LGTVAIRFDCSTLPVAFLYWGRRGALPRFTLDLAQAALGRPDLDLHVSISYQNELFADHAWLRDRLLPIDTFHSAAGVVRTAPAVPRRLRDIRRRLEEREIQVVVVLMPHLWTPQLAPQLKRAGIAYIPVVHDHAAHAGDKTGIANWWLLRDLRHADRIVTLSPFVTRALVASGRASEALIDTLFLPDMSYGGGQPARGDDAAPLRILFFGRILRYKGLPLFIEAIDLLTCRGTRVKAGVFGAGDLANSGERLRALGVEVANRWIDDREISSILARYDVMVLSHTEASQSGVAVAALGAGMPIVATPVGGLVDQVEHEKTGLVARGVDAAALADAIGRLAQDRSLLRAMVDEIGRRRAQRSMSAFLDRLIPIAQRAAHGIAATT
jgi:glycosyltransferase involved in cell wall biosynthesis